MADSESKDDPDDLACTEEELRAVHRKAGVAYPSDLACAEEKLLARRRNAWEAQGDPSFADALRERHAKDRRLGLAPSGGGIRSATFSLGFVQALARAKLLREVDYLSTVSGGSYFGGFLGAYFQRVPAGPPGEAPAAAPQGPGPRSAADVEDDLWKASSTPVGWLRENGRYLAPGGGADGWAALAVVLRNLIAVNVVTWTITVTLFVGLDILRALVQLPPWLEPVRGFLSGDVIWWSPYLAAPALVLAVLLVPLGLAYWLVPGEGLPASARWWLRLRPWWTAGLSAFLLPCLALAKALYPLLTGGKLVWSPWVIAAIVASGLAGLGWISLGAARMRIRDGHGKPRDQLLRAKLSRWLRTWLIVFSALLLVTVVDSLGQTFYRHTLLDPSGHFQIAHAIAVISGLAAAARGVQEVIGALGTRKKIGVPLQVVALLGALVLTIPLLVGLSALGHCIVWQGELPFMTFSGVWQAPAVPGWCWPLVALVIGLGLCFAFGHTYPFLNDSTISGLYAARLTRAYIGASNPKRAEDENTPATEMLPGDVIALRDYQPHAKGGPLHIINTTLNETIGGRSRVEEKDRKGMNLAVGPGGVSVGVKHHATWIGAGTSLVSTDEKTQPDAFRVFPVLRRKDNWPAQKPVARNDRLRFATEPLPLGHWMAISGAAASTALGSMTSIGLSLLCGLLNVRLGHWWQSGVEPKDRPTSAKRDKLQTIDSFLSRLFPVQSHLFQELGARFRGTDARSWYLTDGGHFENTGAYELIRRRVKVIILVDNGADPERRMSDLANLVRKARVDFDTRIEFIDPTEKETVARHPGLVNLQHLIGTLSDLAFVPGDPEAAPVKRYAALARVTYGADGGDDGAERAWLLLVKPSLKDDDSEPVDVRQYRREHGDFPQQTTADQFFDEAQWEAYRKLGEHIGRSLFPYAGADVNAVARFLEIVR